ncbi:MAG: dephospho-CoA kinase [Spirochaetia bacterium]|nr:dephospho-CoA kinase [Spirochaetia bacterium]MBQ3712810.1 dephospho-CoA kinase [Spirochaetia bacterium]MBR0318407.1 dephospho-CoA kinase [Spirochaetia bacterium]
MVVGVAGKTCAGKNLVSRTIAGQGFYHVDVDQLGHIALENQKEKLFKTFGPGIRRHDGSVDRKALGTIVFSSPEEKRKLEAIVHPEMVNMVEDIIEERQNVVVDAAILFEMKLDRLCDLVFWVEAPSIVRFFRGLKRDNVGAWALFKRIWAQRKMNPNDFSSNADIFTISNIGSRKKTADKVVKILEKRK